MAGEQLLRLEPIVCQNNPSPLFLNAKAIPLFLNAKACWLCAGFVQSLMGLKRTVPRSGCCRAQCYVGIWAVPFSFWLLLFFGTAVVACTSDIGAYVGMVEEAGWGVVDEEAYLFGHDGDGVLAE